MVAPAGLATPGAVGELELDPQAAAPIPSPRARRKRYHRREWTFIENLRRLAWPRRHQGAQVGGGSAGPGVRKCASPRGSAPRDCAGGIRATTGRGLIPTVAPKLTGPCASGP